MPTRWPTTSKAPRRSPPLSDISGLSAVPGTDRGRLKRHRGERRAPFIPPTTPDSTATANYDAHVSRARSPPAPHLGELIARRYWRPISGTLLYVRWPADHARLRRIASLSPDATGSATSPREPMCRLPDHIRELRGHDHTGSRRTLPALGILARVPSTDPRRLATPLVTRIRRAHSTSGRATTRFPHSGCPLRWR